MRALVLELSKGLFGILPCSVPTWKSHSLYCFARQQVYWCDDFDYALLQIAVQTNSGWLVEKLLLSSLQSPLTPAASFIIERFPT